MIEANRLNVNFGQRKTNVYSIAEKGESFKFFILKSGFKYKRSGKREADAVGDLRCFAWCGTICTKERENTHGDVLLLVNTSPWGFSLILKLHI